jgi:aspartate racemase
MHRIADSLCESLSVPLVNIIDETAAALRSNGHERPILLGTRFTMQEAFYRDRLERRGLNVLLPSVDEQRVVHALIYDELMLGQVTRSGRVTLANIIARLAGEGG